ncbi:hypothetical protein EX30DRAFT_394594 [Ascodesmis nigricans]|uniref:DUF202 domain-containing protein n=1 Tax=Ascodesmis nigricans TaxID=341454 RepID=A0A4S2N351_9PEZI|nr:hypothetical protein EX30DRAFT_394594 [Ascodesmis nigricans]
MPHDSNYTYHNLPPSTTSSSYDHIQPLPSPPPRSLTSVINSAFSPELDTELRARGAGDLDSGTEVEDDDEGEERMRRRRVGRGGKWKWGGGLDDGEEGGEGWNWGEDTAVGRFWGRKVACTVPGESARDHLALERTYLAYHRTSLVLALFSVIIAQLQVLQHAPQPDKTFGFYVLGKPLSGLFASMAILVSVVGVARWWRLQQALLRGKAVGGGWEILVIGGVMGGAVAVVFVLVLVAGVRRTYLRD